MSELKDRIEQVNARLFGLEGRMNTLEQVSEIQAAARKELLETIVHNQAMDRARYEQDKKEAQERTRSWVIKIVVGIVIILVTKLIEVTPAIVALLHKP